MKQLGGMWDEKLEHLFKADNYKKIREFLIEEYSNYTIYPEMFDVFNCFRITPYDELKAVILGQDPYHEKNQAHGLCFSVQDNIKKPPSLKNIFKELNSDLGIKEPKNGNLTNWGKNGVLLLNTSLTVREGLANSHKNCGWEWFTDEVIKVINNKNNPVVFILWGANARSKKKFIDLNKHFIIESAHPSPLSCYNGFFGSCPFSKCNNFLKEHNLKEINWNL